MKRLMLVKNFWILNCKRQPLLNLTQLPYCITFSGLWGRLDSKKYQGYKLAPSSEVILWGNVLITFSRLGLFLCTNLRYRPEYVSYFLPTHATANTVRSKSM